MQLTNIRFNDNNNNNQEIYNDLNRQLSVPILFGYQNGVISEVCIEQEEENNADNNELRALDIKKSIISTLQTIPDLSITSPVKVSVFKFF